MRVLTVFNLCVGVGESGSILLAMLSSSVVIVIETMAEAFLRMSMSLVASVDLVIT